MAPSASLMAVERGFRVRDWVTKRNPNPTARELMRMGSRVSSSAAASSPLGDIGESLEVELDLIFFFFLFFFSKENCRVVTSRIKKIFLNILLNHINNNNNDEVSTKPFILNINIWSKPFIHVGSVTYVAVKMP